jgi:hypothetical protein
MCVAIIATEVRHLILCEDMWCRFKEDKSMPEHVLLLLDEVIGELKRLYYGELYDLHSSPNTIK